jgi:5-methylcytosine-specific restriction endonuclease McrA
VIWKETPNLQEKYSLPLSPSQIPAITPTALDSLTTYIVPETSPLTVTAFFTSVLTAYINIATTAPPPPISTKSLHTECELCTRTSPPITLTYHHLIPRSMHVKVVKRGWHLKEDLQNVAWLCGPCHRFVHRIAPNEELARSLYTVERLEEREDVQKWIGWLGKVRPGKMRIRNV